MTSQKARHPDQGTKFRRKHRGITLSPMSRKAIALLRRLPKHQARFSLYLTSEETTHRLSIIINGDSIPDSVYYVHVAKDGTIPPNLPPTATYVARDPAEADTILCWIADNPSLFSKSGKDALDKPNAVPYEDDPEDWED